MTNKQTIKIYTNTPAERLPQTGRGNLLMLNKWQFSQIRYGYKLLRREGASPWAARTALWYAMWVGRADLLLPWYEIPGNGVHPNEDAA